MPRIHLKRRDLNSSYILGCSGRNNSKPSVGSSGQAEDTRSGQTRKKPKDLSTREREERGCGSGGVLYVVYMCERGGGGRGELDICFLGISGETTVFEHMCVVILDQDGMWNKDNDLRHV
jgi:hypothetical protein